MCIIMGHILFYMIYHCHAEYFYANTILPIMAQSLYCQLVSIRGRFRISGKGVQMYKGGSHCWFYIIFLKYPMKINWSRWDQIISFSWDFFKKRGWGFELKPTQDLPLSMYFLSVDLDGLASSEASWSGSTVFSKADKSEISRTKVNYKRNRLSFWPSYTSKYTYMYVKCMLKMFIFFKNNNNKNNSVTYCCWIFCPLMSFVDNLCKTFFVTECRSYPDTMIGLLKEFWEKTLFKSTKNYPKCKVKCQPS